MFIFLLLCVSVHSGATAAKKTGSSLVQSISVWWLSPSLWEWKRCGFKRLLRWRLMLRLCREDAVTAGEGGRLAAPAVALRCPQAFLPVLFMRGSYKLKLEVSHSSPYWHGLFPHLSLISCEIIGQIQLEFTDRFGVPESVAHRK